MKKMLNYTLWGLGIIACLAIATVWLGPDLYGRYLRPDHPFDHKHLPGKPDYSQQAFWAAWPETGSPAERLPAGVRRTPEADRLADVFFLPPTTYAGTEHWVAPPDHTETNRNTDLWPISWQASVFNGCCRVHAPRFRQATIGAYAAKDAETFHRVMDVAYQDVKAAFHHFLTRTAPDRPLILASHSQGTFHLVRLVMEEVDGTPLMDRLVAVYAIGHSLTHALLEDGYREIPLCRSPTQTGCFISWDAHEADKTPSRWGDEEGDVTWNGSGYGGFGVSKRICVNPISWYADNRPSMKDHHKGAIAYVEGSNAIDAPLPGVLISGTVSAACEQGAQSNWLWVNGDRHPSLKRAFPWSLFVRNLRGSDYSLFWADIRQNAEDRTRAFVASRK